MANITDQFVTSFSELYYSTTRITAGDQTNPSESEVRSWFTASGSNATAKVATQIVSGTIVAGLLTVNIGSLDSEVITVEASDTAALVAGKIRLELAANPFITSVGGSGANLIVTYAVDAGDVTLTVSGTTGVVMGVEAVGTPFAAGSNGTHLIPLVMEIGTLSNEATVIDTPTFGEVYRGKLRGQLDGGQLDAQLYWAPRNAFHQELRELSESGTQVYVGIKWNSDASATNSEFVYFDSFVSSFGIDTTFDDVAKVSMTLVVDGAEHFASDE